MLFRFLEALGFTDLTATLNCIPSGAARESFSQALREHVRPKAASLGPEDAAPARGKPAAPLRLEGPRSRHAAPGRSVDPRVSGRGVAPAPRGAQGAAAPGRRALHGERGDRARPRLLHPHGVRGRLGEARRAERDPGRRPLRRPRGPSRRAADARGGLRHRRGPARLADDDGRPRPRGRCSGSCPTRRTSSPTRSPWLPSCGPSCPTRRWRAIWRAAASARGCRGRRRFCADPGRHAQRARGVRAVLLGSREREDGNVTIKDLATRRAADVSADGARRAPRRGEGTMTPTTRQKAGELRSADAGAPCS